MSIWVFANEHFCLGVLTLPRMHQMLYSQSFISLLLLEIEEKIRSMCLIFLILPLCIYDKLQIHTGYFYVQYVVWFMIFLAILTILSNKVDGKEKDKLDIFVSAIIFNYMPFCLCYYLLIILIACKTKKLSGMNS